jgi:membrane associated rhomboid family serine protease
MREPIEVFNSLVIGVTCLVSWLAFRNPALEEKYIFEPRAILAGKEYYRLISSGFLHSGWWHLFLNMMSLFLFGGPIEAGYGTGNFLLIYFGAIIGGNLLSLYIHRHHEYSAYGASGGVCGILFAYLLLFPGASIQAFLMPVPIPGWLYAIAFMIASFVAMKSSKDNIGHDAHLGGAILGLLIAAALNTWIARVNWKIFLAVLATTILLLIWFWSNPLLLPATPFPLRSKARTRLANMPPHKRESVQIDAILEKINTQGIDSLSPTERGLLENTSAKFQSRAQSKKPESGLAI